MKNFIIGILIVIVGFITPITTVVRNIQFDQKCGGFLKQAADANTVELAIDRLNKAIDFIESNNLTSGYTSVLWRTEDENIEYWYQNIKACRDELKEALESSALEKSNLLMKVRESLTDDNENGTMLTIPMGISRYPHNLLFGILNTLSAFIILFGIFVMAAIDFD